MQASNQGALIMKILSERCETVPTRYSKSLRSIVSRCLTKEPAGRPDTWDLLCMPEVASQGRSMDVAMPTSLITRGPVLRHGSLSDPRDKAPSSTSSSTHADVPVCIFDERKENAALPRPFQKPKEGRSLYIVCAPEHCCCMRE